MGSLVWYNGFMLAPASVCALATALAWASSSSLPVSGATGAAERWVRIETPSFSLMTDADPRNGRNVALEFERARAVLQEAFTAETEVRPALPIVIFAVRDVDGLRSLLPGLPGPSGEMPVGVFQSSPDRHRIAVRLDESSEHRFQTVYHEYHHLLFRSSADHVQAPVWLVEGLAEFWSSMERRRGGERIEIGRPNPRHLRTLKLRGMLPLGRLLRYSGNVHEEPPELIEIIYAQSWALVHHLMLENAGASSRATASAKGRARFERYLDRIDEAADTDAGLDPVTVFEAAFGPVASVEAALRSYLDQTMFPVLTVAVPVPPPASKFRITSLDEAEVEASIGMFVATGPWPKRATLHLERALAVDPDSASAMEGMGFVSFREGDLEGAEAWFVKAARADETSYLAHYYTGVLVKARGGPSEVVVERLERAIELNPRFAPAFVLLSDHLSEQAGRLEEALALAREAARLAPDAALVWANLASILTRLGRTEEAERALQRARARGSEGTATAR